MKKQVLFIILGCFLLSTLYPLPFLAGCKKKEVKAPVEKVINVKIQPAEEKPLRPFVEAIGTLNPYEEVIVSAEVDGILKDVRVDEGTLVSKGMVLAIIDDTDYDLEAKQAEAFFRQVEASLSNTRMEYKRKETLYKEELVTKQQFDDVSTRLSLAEAEVERAKASFSLANQRLLKTKIYSPLSGVVKEKKISAGNYVKKGTALFVIIQTNPLKLNFTVSEKDIGKLRVGQDVLLKVDALPDREFKGRLSIIYPSLEERTRTLQVEARILNPHGFLKPGLFAKVTLYTGAAKSTITIPVTALLYEGTKVTVFVVEGDRAKERKVELGSKYGESMEIVEGLKEGELVVTVGQQNLFEGAKVNIIN